jgi:hypothetical protein
MLSEIEIGDHIRATKDQGLRTRLVLLLTLAVSTAALFIVLAWPMLTGRIYTANDLGEFHLPLRNFYAQQLASSEPFDWCPGLYCGFYLTGEGQVGAYHPLHWLLYRTLPLWLAFDLECWLSYPLLLAGLYLFLRRWRIDRAASLFGAMAFTFGSFNLLHFVHPNAIAIIAQVPWLLCAIDVLFDPKASRRRPMAFTAISLLTASQLLLGYPQYVLFSLAAEAGYAIALLTRGWMASRPPSPHLIPVVLWITATALGVLIAAIQLLPTFDALNHSVRHPSSADATKLAIDGSLAPLNLVQLVAPYLFRNRVAGQNTIELGLYVGAGPLVLALWWLSSGHGPRRRFRVLTTAAATCAILTLLWALGDYGPLSWFQRNVPLVSSFRLPCRAIVIFQLAVAVLAALGLTSLLRRDRPRLHPPKSRLLPLFAISGLAAAVATLRWPEHISSFPLVAVGPLLFAAAIWLVNSADAGSRWALPALVVLSAVDLGCYGMSAGIFQNVQTLSDFVSETDAPLSTPGARIALDLVAGTEQAPGQKTPRIGNRILLAGWKRVDGYAGLEPARQLDYRSLAALQAAGTMWASATAAAKIETQTEHSTKAEREPNWVRLADSRPRAWFVTSAIPSFDPATDINRIDLASEALIDSGQVPQQLSPSPKGSVKIQTDRPGHFAVTTDCPSAQLLIVNESFYTGWKATIDGQVVDVLRANGDFLGVLVRAGQHEIRLTFQPDSLYYGRLTSSFGLGLMIVALLPWLALSHRAPKRLAR